MRSVFALAFLSVLAASCARRSPEHPSTQVAPSPHAPSASTAPPRPSSDAVGQAASQAAVDGGETRSNEERDPPADPSCSNAEGVFQACSRVIRGCDGLAVECRSIANGEMQLRPRVAQRFAECFAKVRAPACRNPALGACMRQAVLSACIEPGTVRECRSIMSACRAAGRPPSYTLEQCAKVLSAVLPSAEPDAWERVDRERLGPSDVDDGCSLRDVLPYQPWGISWGVTAEEKKRR